MLIRELAVLQLLIPGKERKNIDLYYLRLNKIVMKASEKENMWWFEKILFLDSEKRAQTSVIIVIRSGGFIILI